jgi:hypothetical protein
MTGMATTKVVVCDDVQTVDDARGGRRDGRAAVGRAFVGGARLVVVAVAVAVAVAVPLRSQVSGPVGVGGTRMTTREKV